MPTRLIQAYNMYNKGRRMNLALGKPINKSWNLAKRYNIPYGRRPQSFKKRVNRLIQANHELKFIDNAVSTSTPVGGTSVVSPLSLVGEGDTDILRDGQEIYLHSVQIKLFMTQDTTPTSATEMKLMVILARKNVDGVLPVITDFLMSDDPASLKQIDGRGDFQVLFSQDYLFQPPILAGNQQNLWINYYKKFKKPIKATYDSDQADITAAEKNHLFMVLMTNQPTASQPTWSGNTRVTFKD